MNYMTKSWTLCRVRHASSVPFSADFKMRLRNRERPKQIAYARIMNRYDGNPSGIEHRHHTHPDRWAFVLENASKEGYRCQFFDTGGLAGHIPFDDLSGAVDEMVARGFHIEDVGAFDRTAEAPGWVDHSETIWNPITQRTGPAVQLAA